MMEIRRHVYYTGRVQGVGFRFAVERLARGATVRGFVRNLSDGRVELVAEGPEEHVTALLSEIQRAMGAYIGNADIRSEEPTEEFLDFRIAFGRG